MKAHILMLYLFCTISFAAIGQPKTDLRVLVYAGGDYWHGQVIPEAIKAFQALAERHSFELEWTQEKSFFTHRKISPFDVLVFLNANPNDFADADKIKFQEFIRNGGGFVGVHAVISNGSWAWFDSLVGRQFKYHPKFQTAVLDVADPNHLSTIHLPKRYLWSDEFYVFGKPLTDNQKVVLRVDRTTYDSVGNRTESQAIESNEEKDFLPMAWYHEFDGGRSFYTALGHSPALYADRNFIEHIFGGICWVSHLAQKSDKGDLK